MKYIIFKCLCERFLWKKENDIHFKIIMPMQEWVAMPLHRLDTGDGLQNIGYLYGVHKS